MPTRIRMGAHPPGKRPQQAQAKPEGRGPSAAPAPEPPKPAGAREDPSLFAETFQPPQGPGPERRPFATGGPAREDRISIALKILRDPVARASFSRIYSGQARPWSR